MSQVKFNWVISIFKFQLYRKGRDYEAKANIEKTNMACAKDQITVRMLIISIEIMIDYVLELKKGSASFRVVY